MAFARVYHMTVERSKRLENSLHSGYDAASLAEDGRVTALNVSKTTRVQKISLQVDENQCR